MFYFSIVLYTLMDMLLCLLLNDKYTTYLKIVLKQFIHVYVKVYTFYVLLSSEKILKT